MNCYSKHGSNTLGLSIRSSLVALLLLMTGFFPEQSRAQVDPGVVDGILNLCLPGISLREKVVTLEFKFAEFQMKFDSLTRMRESYFQLHNCSGWDKASFLNSQSRLDNATNLINLARETIDFGNYELIYSCYACLPLLGDTCTDVHEAVEEAANLYEQAIGELETGLSELQIAYNLLKANNCSNGASSFSTPNPAEPITQPSPTPVVPETSTNSVSGSDNALLLDSLYNTSPTSASTHTGSSTYGESVSYGNSGSLSSSLSVSSTSTSQNQCSAVSNSWGIIEDGCKMAIRSTGHCPATSYARHTNRCHGDCTRNVVGGTSSVRCKQVPSYAGGCMVDPYFFETFIRQVAEKMCAGATKR